MQICDITATNQKSFANDFIICQTDIKDIYEIITFLSDNLINENPYVILNQLLNADIDFQKSLKIIHKKTKKIYGLLILCNYPIDKGTPLSICKPRLTNYLCKLKHVNGYAFVIDKSLRGQKIDMQLLHKCLENIKEYDYIWCGVDINLKSHNYWKRMGFIEVCNIHDAKFYLYPIKKNVLLDIFIIEMIANSNEKNYT